MNKKEFYEAPKWGTRVVMVERHILDGSPDGSWGNSIQGGSTWPDDEPSDGYGLED